MTMREVHADAPGRVNLIGEHTDYQDGFVLPCAVPQRTRAILNVRDDRTVRAWSDAFGDRALEYVLGEERRASEWGDYVQGVTWVVQRENLPLRGFDLRLRSDVPVGAGLSSSAALEVSTLRAMREAFALPLDDVALARAAQRAEVEFVGAPVGIMDQMAASLAGEREGLFLDTRTLHFERVALPSSLDLIVIDSGVAHQHAGGDYRTRRRESEEAARLLGVAKLRDIGDDASDRLGKLPPVLQRRARHIVTENARVLRARDALRSGDLSTLGELFNASHASLRDDYEVSIPPVDSLVEIACRQRGVFGARMTGGGFGGAVVIAAAAGSGVELAQRIHAEYARQSGRNGSILLPIAARG